MNELSKTYEEFISQFPVYDTYQKAYYAKRKRKGLEAHHITPIGTQEGCNRENPKDDRCVLLTYSQHIIAHYLYCKEHPEDIKEFTALNFLCNFHAKDFLNNKGRFLEELPDLERMREKGRQHTKEAKEKISQANRKRTSETREKVSSTMKSKGEAGDLNWKRVFMFDTGGHLKKEFKSITEASRELGICMSTVHAYLNGKYPKKPKYLLSYTNSYIE